jgi:hypothetical protein
VASDPRDPNAWFWPVLTGVCCMALCVFGMLWWMSQWN